MTRPIPFLVAALAVASAGPLLAIPGIPDRVPAATLLAPFFETGIDPATYPHDTLLVVRNRENHPVRIHWHYWTVDGEATALNGNVLLAAASTWSAASRDLLGAGPSAAREDLVQGPFYRGFVTIDVVSQDTAFDPRQRGYPFGASNSLEGFVYYTRLSQGSANGLAMVPIEEVPDTVPTRLRGFYQFSDHREEIDADARACAAQLINGSACSGDPVPGLSRTDFRVFGSTPLAGASRLVVFAWTPGYTGGPSLICHALGTCDETYQYRLFDEAGSAATSTTLYLVHVVNLIAVDSNVSGTSSLWDLPAIGGDTQYYAFSFNSAAPAANPNLTWDAIFEAYVDP